MSMLKWDGSNISSILEELRIKEFEMKGKHYWKISGIKRKASSSDDKDEVTGDFKDRIYVMVHRGGSNVICCVDELKPLFGINKTGTHHVIIKSRVMSLIRINFILHERSRNDEIIPDVPIIYYEDYTLNGQKDQFRLSELIRTVASINIQGGHSLNKKRNGSIDEQWILDEFPDIEVCMRWIQIIKCLIFRAIIGSGRNNMESILFRHHLISSSRGNRSYKASVILDYQNTINPAKMAKHFIPRKAFDSLFIKRKIETSIILMYMMNSSYNPEVSSLDFITFVKSNVHINHRNTIIISKTLDLSNVNYRYRNTIEKVVKRCMPERLGMINHILKRIDVVYNDIIK